MLIQSIFDHYSKNPISTDLEIVCEMGVIVCEIGVFVCEMGVIVCEMVNATNGNLSILQSKKSQRFYH